MFGVITPFQRRYYATFGIITPFERRYYAKFGIITPFERRYYAFLALLHFLEGIITQCLALLRLLKGVIMQRLALLRLLKGVITQRLALLRLLKGVITQSLALLCLSKGVNMLLFFCIITPFERRYYAFLALFRLLKGVITLFFALLFLLKGVITQSLALLCFLANLSQRLTRCAFSIPIKPASIRRSSNRPLSSTISNIFLYKTTGPVIAKFYVEPLWVGGTKVCSRHLGHLTKMAAKPIYGKNSSKIFSGTIGLISMKLGL